MFDDTTKTENAMMNPRTIEFICNYSHWRF
jgi:hypothetical protein